MKAILKTSFICVAWVLGFGLVAACSSEPEPGEKDPPFSNVTSDAGTDATDPMIGVACETNEDCPAPEPRCRGDVALVYTGPGICLEDDKVCNFAPVTEQTACSANQQACESGVCVNTPCTGVTCEQPQDRCEGNELVFYTGPGSCNRNTGECEPPEFRRDCAELGGECMFSTCVGPCVGVTCDDPPESFCDADTGEAVSFVDGTCDPADESCSYTEERETCEDPQICVGGACVDDPCDGVTCTPPADACMDNTLVTHSGDGTCDAATGICDYSQVEVSTDCMGEMCIDAACVDTTPAAGELVIVEVMRAPLEVLPAAGQWFEIVNVTTRPLNLEGLEITSTDDPGYTVNEGQPTLLDPDARFVFGNNADSATNGGISVDLEYVDVELTETDALGLALGADVIDSIAIDGVAWPVTDGASMTFGDQYDAAVDDNADPAFWCDASTMIANSTDLGTPGNANDACP